MSVCCKFCKSESIIKYGKEKDKQKYFCKSCKKSFTNPDNLKGMWYDKKIINRVLDLFYQGLSLRLIRQHLTDYFSLTPAVSTIYNWIVIFSKKAKETVDKFKVNLSKLWHVDETVIKVKNNNCYYWVILDSNSRFMISSNLTLTRTLDEGKEVFVKSKQIANEPPKFIFSDGYGGYPKLVEGVFGDKKQDRQIKQEPYTKHIKVIQIRDKGCNNNIVERVMGYIKSFYKIRRGFKSLSKANIIFQGLQVYYNFLRPHESLEGKTPAEFCNVGLDVRERWLSLISS